MNSQKRDFAPTGFDLDHKHIPVRLRRLSRNSTAGVTLVETVVSLMIIIIGLAGIFATCAQCYALLRRSKEIVAVREDVLSRLDVIRTLSYSQLTKPSYLTGTLLVSGNTGDASPFGMTTTGMKDFTETVTVYALGAQLFSDDAGRSNATPDSTGEYASQVDSVAPDAPKTYKANSTGKGDWTLQVAGALDYIKVVRTGTGSQALTTIVHQPDPAGAGISIYPQVRVDVTYTWTDSHNITRTQVGSTIVSKMGSLL